MAALNGLVILLLTISAMFISECYSSGENKPIQREDQCQNMTCQRRVSHLGVRETTGCPPGCLCVIRAPDNIDNANGTCYQLMSTTTPTTTTPDVTTSSEVEE